MYNDWFQFTDISFPLLLISRMLSRIQPVYYIRYPDSMGKTHRCVFALSYPLRLNFIEATSSFSSVTGLKSEDRSLTSNASFDWKRERYEMEKFVANTKIIANEELYLELESDKKKTIFVEISLELNPLKREIVG